MANVTLVVPRGLEIPANTARVKFQGGRSVRGVSRYEPWCELMSNEVANYPRAIEPGRFQVRRGSQVLIKDYISGIPAIMTGFGCDDLVFQQTTLWTDRRGSPEILYLRCFAPYTNCRLGPPLSLQEMRFVVGPELPLELVGGR